MANENKANNGFPEFWHSTYWYPSNKLAGDEPSEYDMECVQDGDTLVFESLPNKEQSYMLIRIKVVGEIATGNWYETTSPTGEFKGAIYSGAGQLMVNPETKYMEGKWAGAGYDHKLKAMRIYTGNWEIVPKTETV